MGPQRAELLATYLNDHLAGATLGVELARRMRAGNEDDPRFGAPMAKICAEIEADRATLKRVMEQLKVRRSLVKPVGAWATEKLGRLKLNGQVRGYSPLSRLVELEGLYIGITGKMQMWNALENVLGGSFREFDFGHLAERACRQRAVVRELHLAAATLAFPSPQRTSFAFPPAGKSEGRESLQR